MVAAPSVVNDITAFIGLFLAVCAALAMLWRIARPAFIESVRDVVRAEIQPVVEDQAAMRRELVAHLRTEEAEIAEIKLALGNEGRIAVRFGEIEHELAKHMEDRRAHMR